MCWDTLGPSLVLGYSATRGRHKCESLYLIINCMNLSEIFSLFNGHVQFSEESLVVTGNEGNGL